MNADPRRERVNQRLQRVGVRVVASSNGVDQEIEVALRVLFLIKGLGRGGAEMLVLDLAAHFVEHGHDVTVAYQRADKDDLVGVLRQRGVSVERIVNLRHLAELMGAADVVHSHSPVLAGIARLTRAARPTLHPTLVTTEHHHWGVLHPLTRALQRATSHLDDAAIAVSAEAAASRSTSAVDVTVLHHGLDQLRLIQSVPDLHEVRTMLRADGHPLVVHVGNHRWQKDHPTLIRAAALIKERFGREVVIVSLGDGPQFTQHARLAEELGSPIELLGTRSDARAIIAAADVFVLPSVEEGLPVALMEAMILGRPIVATSVGGMAEVLADGRNAILVKPQDPEAVSAAVLRLLGDPELADRLSSAAAQDAAKFDVAHTAEVYLKTYGQHLAPQMAVDERTVRGFGDEWSRFDQSDCSDEDLQETFNKYFAIFPWADLPTGACGLDVGCGSGRWARLVSPKVGSLTAVDPSREALRVAKKNLEHSPNITLREGAAGALPDDLQDFDFAYALGVIHHTPDPQTALNDVVTRVRPGAPVLLYLYYALDNRPAWFRGLWRVTDIIRRIIARLPTARRSLVTDVIAVTVYWPLARLALLVERLGGNPDPLPLSQYANKPLYVLRTDALDRFGTAVEHRFTKEQMHRLMQSAGLRDIAFSDGPPYWCAVGRRASNRGATE